MPKNLKKILLASGLFLILITVFAVPVLSQNATNVEKIDDPLNLKGNPYELYARIIQAFLGFVGVIALVFFIIGGFTMLTSAGNPEKVKKGRDILLWAVIGIAVCLSSYAILNFVLETLTTATEQTTSCLPYKNML